MLIRIQSLAAATLAALVLGSFYYMRYQPIVACLAVLAFAVLVRSTGLWRRNRALVAIVGVDLALVFLYLWSLDEYVHVVIQASPNGYIATIDGQRAILRVPVQSGLIGFTAGSEEDYRVKVTVNVSAPHPTTIANRFTEYVRFAAPRPAWTNLALTIPGHAPHPLLLTHRQDIPPSSWSVNRRGELEGDLGSFTILDVNPGTTFTLTADLARPEATQGIVLGTTNGGHAYQFAIRFDTPDAGWFDWHMGQSGKQLAGVGPWFNTPELLRHILRLYLSQIIFALLLVLASPPLYLLLSWIHGEEASFSSISQRIHRLSESPILDIAAICAALAAVLAAAIVATMLFERVPHDIDSVAYYFQAQTLASGHLFLPAPSHPDFFPVPFTLIHQHQWFGKYPPGWPMLLAIGMKFGVPWLVNPLLAGANILLLYLIGREVYGKVVAILAAVFALSSPFLLALAGDYISHLASVFFLSLALYFFVRWVRFYKRGLVSSRKNWMLLVPAGFSLGMASITRSFDMILFCWPFLLFIIRRPNRESLRSLGWIALGASPVVTFALIYDLLLTGSALLTPFALSDASDHPGFGVAEGVVGHFTLAEGLWDTVWRSHALFAALLGWPFYCTLALAFLPFLLGRASRWDVSFAMSAGSVILGHAAYFGSAANYAPRYYAAAAPSLLLLTARGFQELHHLRCPLPPRVRPGPLTALVLPATLAVFLVACSLFTYLPLQLPVYRDYFGSTAAYIQPLERAHLHHALVFVQPLGTSQYLISPTSSPFALWLPLLLNSSSLHGDVVYEKDLGRLDSTLASQYPGYSLYRLGRIHSRRPTILLRRIQLSAIPSTPPTRNRPKVRPISNRRLDM